MVGVEQWAEIRRLFFVRGLSMREIDRRTGLHRDTISRAIHSEAPPVYRRAPSGSKLDPFKEEIHRLLRVEPRLPGQRVRELIAPLGFDGGKTIVDDYCGSSAVVSPPPRTFQRMVYRPGEVCQFDLWEPREGVRLVRPDPTGRGRRCAPGVLARWRGALVFSEQTLDLLAGIGAACRWECCDTLVWDRQAGLHAGAGARPSISPRSAGR